MTLIYSTTFCLICAAAMIDLIVLSVVNHSRAPEHVRSRPDLEQDSAPHILPNPCYYCQTGIQKLANATSVPGSKSKMTRSAVTHSLHGLAFVLIGSWRVIVLYSCMTARERRRVGSSWFMSLSGLHDQNDLLMSLWGNVNMDWVSLSSALAIQPM